MQDNASAHGSSYTNEWLEMNDVDVLLWPTKSPDLNRIENVLAVLAGHVYAGNRQCQNLQGRHELLEKEFNYVSSTYIRSLYDSLHKRLTQV